MPSNIRLASPQDIPHLVDLLLADANQRRLVNMQLWKIADDAPAQIETALRNALTAENQPFRQFWHVACSGERITGVVHSMMLPVPPIYAGSDGEPGLVLPDSYVANDAPTGTAEDLLSAAEAALRAAGARILLSSYVTGAVWRDAFAHSGHAPLTLYLSRSGLTKPQPPAEIRPAAYDDIAGIVRQSAQNRRVLFAIDPFWEPHADADARFSAWMTRSLTLPDRDMLVTGPPGNPDGYIIAQPASRLHFPAAHDIDAVGVIDDYYHPDFDDIAQYSKDAEQAKRLLNAAEAAFAKRGVDTAFVVCPAGWTSKVDMLTTAGYETAMVWGIKR